MLSDKKTNQYHSENDGGHLKDKYFGKECFSCMAKMLLKGKGHKNS